MKRFLSVIFLFIPLFLYAETYEGTWYNNISWSYNSDNSTLTISGNGEIPDKSFPMPYTEPWSDYVNFGISFSNKLVLSEGITRVGNYQFVGCQTISSIQFPSTLTSVGDESFTDMGLTSLSIPSTLTHLGRMAFTGGYTLSSISVASSNPIYDSRGNCNAVIETSSNSLVLGCQATTIPSTVVAIGYGAFNACMGLTSLTLPSGVERIEPLAFANCSSLSSSIVIPTGVKQIGSEAFSGCFSIPSVTFPEGLEVISGAAFVSCRTLRSVVLPSTLKEIGSFAFGYCDALESINIPSGVTSLSDSIWLQCPNLATIDCYLSAPLEVGEYTFLLDDGMKSSISRMPKSSTSSHTLIVNPGSSSLFTMAEHWNKFNIVEREGSITSLQTPTIGLDLTSPLYNVQGCRVSPSYKGIVIQGGRKFYQLFK